MLVAVGLFATTVQADEGRAVLVEAEAFDDYGGWVDDSQFMDAMGSPFLLAHGLGVPVNDASTTVRFPAAGTYRVWVRTRDWVAPWNADGAPGRFRLVVDGKPVPKVFGTKGAQWQWHDGGKVTIDKQTVRVALNDLTGFEGRCDAVLFTSDPDFTPPNEVPAMAVFRRKLLALPERPEDGGQFDLVVVGGGIAGTCAALSAARLDLKVALIQDRPVLGGNNSSEVRVWLAGVLGRPPYPRVGDVVRELEQTRRAHYGPDNTAEIYEDDRKTALVEAEENITLMLGHRANAADMREGRITAVVAQNTRSGRRVRLAGRWFADCTGDGALGALAGADFAMTRKGHMGQCNLWNVVATDRPQPFPRCPWALDLSDKPFPGRGDDMRGPLALGVWNWEAGFDRDPIVDRELIRDWNFRAMYGAWDALKNVDRVYPNHKLNWAAHISGLRESRRLLGDVVLSREDLMGSKEYTDGCVPTGWKIDLHLPDARYAKGFEDEAFISKAHFTDFPQPYWVPYRCLYSRNVPNLFMAGRDISVTHEALGSVRVMRTCGMMGEIVGMAASLCQEHDTDPRGVYRSHLDELKQLMLRGIGKRPEPRVRLRPPEWLKTAGPNLAPAASVRVSASRDVAANPPGLINDGRFETRENDLRWLGDGPLPHRIELSWSKRQSISAVRIISGFYDSLGRILGPIEDFAVEYHDENQWKEIPAARVAGNRHTDWHVRFPALVTDKIRVLINKTQADVSRIWEVEVY